MFGSGDSFHQHKNPVPVRVEISRSDPVEGLVFLAVGDRLSDLLNDARPFIPVRRADGETVIVAKQHIVSIIEREANAQELIGLAAAEKKAPESKDPYALLLVAPDAPMAEITASCRRLTEQLLARHKKRVDGEEPQVKSALNAAKKILDAYKVILRDRGLDKGGDAKSDAPSGASKQRRRAAQSY